MIFLQIYIIVSYLGNILYTNYVFRHTVARVHLVAIHEYYVISLLYNGLIMNLLYNGLIMNLGRLYRAARKIGVLWPILLP